MYSARVPSGAPPPPADAGARFCQKMEWFTCPPPLKRIAACRPIMASTSPLASASAYFSRATFRLVT